MADWRSFEIQLPGADLLEPVRSVLEQLLIFLDILKAILDTIKVFLVDFGNPIKALVEALIAIIEELFLALKASGVFMLIHAPDPRLDPNFNFNKGYDSFLKTFKSSLFDTQDLNRPQPRPGSSSGGFVLLVVQDTSSVGLVGKLKQLLRFFSKEFTTPRYEIPRNFKVSPLSETGDPLLSVASVFAGSSNSVALTWSLPTTQETPDPGFQDLVNRVGEEFIPPKFIIERAEVASPSSQKIDIADITSETAQGIVEFSRETTTTTSQKASKREILRDIYGEPVIKFTQVTILDEADISNISGQLGRFRYVDDDVEPDTTYFYRVRALSGDLKLTSGGQIDWPDPKKIPESNIPVVQWPSASTDEVVPGKATGIVSVRLPNLDFTPEEFDVLLNLRYVFQSAFAMDFHREIEPEEVSPPIGKGSLTQQAGMVARRNFGTSVIATIQQESTVTESLSVFTTETGLTAPTFPWEEIDVRRQSSVLADAVAAAMMQSGKEVVEGFRSLMQQPQTLLGESSLEDAVFKLVNQTEADESVYQLATTLGEAYESDTFRDELLGVINFLLPLTYRGTPPDWISVVPLRDIIPWSGQIIYELLDKIQALVDGFSGVIAEINAFIELLEQKIATLEATLQFLISILDLIESLQFGAFILSVPQVNGSAVDWVREVDTAGGVAPLTGPAGYSGGVALAYVAPDVTAFTTAFSIIFG